MHGKFLGTLHRGESVRRKVLPLVIGLAFAGAAWGQATNGTIRGTVPAASGETIRITGGSGYDRTINVGSNGNYSVTLPVGTYTVTLLRDGEVVDSRNGVSPAAGGAVTINFSGTENATELGGITVSAMQTPAIDVTTTNQVTTITHADLERLPLARNAENIALLAPGVNVAMGELRGGPLGTPAVTFGGASQSENAYYIDGMNTTDALYNQGGIGLPYNSIAQQQTFTSGYGSKYGRSIGGVISQVGRSGTNEWHFGARVLWEPASLRGTQDSHYYVNPLFQGEGQQPGDLSVYGKAKGRMQTTYDVYVGGPIIKDKLFFFLSAEWDKIQGKTVGSFESQHQFNYRTENPKIYFKVNWNINSRNLLTLTALQSSHKYWESQYAFDYETLSTGEFESLNQTSKTQVRLGILNYTSYITDNLTLNAMVGKTHTDFITAQPAFPGFDPTLPLVGGISFQNPAYVPTGGISNSQTSQTQDLPTHRMHALSYRVSFDYQLGTHTLTAGIDNRVTRDIDEGFVGTGPGYAWFYGRGAPDEPVFGVDPDIPPYAGPPNSNPAGVDGYYVNKQIFNRQGSVKVTQRAQYIQDAWQITPNFLLTMGLRNDQFINTAPSGVSYIRLTQPQWAPRLGFSWDVHGDSTLKVFGNAGRYYLAVPLHTAMPVTASTFLTNLYGTYTGIDPETGEPIGFEPLPQNPSTGVSINNQYGQPKNPRSVAATNLKAQYSDNFVLGMQKAFEMLGTNWVFGVTGTYQHMDRILDDYADFQRMCTAGREQGYDWMTPDSCSDWTPSLLMINPGETAHVMLGSPDGGLVPVVLTKEDQGFAKSPTRQYYSIDFSLGHQWDGKWSLMIDYLLSRTWGNTQGPVSTYSQQSGTNLTTDWDFPERMEHSSGDMPGDRRHQIKIHGAYAFNEEWTVGANAYITSGTPRLCRGYYGPDQTRLHGSSTFHWCGGKPAPPGSMGRTPWIHEFSFNVDYKPAWAGHKLDFNLAVFRLFNGQTPTFYNDLFLGTSNPNPDYGRVQDTRPPRSVRFSIAYNF